MVRFDGEVGSGRSEIIRATGVRWKGTPLAELARMEWLQRSATRPPTADIDLRGEIEKMDAAETRAQGERDGIVKGVPTA